MNNEISSLSIIDQADITTFKETMHKITQWQKLVKENLKEGKDYGIIPGTSKPTLYKSGAEKIFMLGKLRSTFDILDETKDWEKEFFQFEIRWNLWVGENLICQGIGLCSSKEDKYRYRWVNENKLPNNIKKEDLVYRIKSGQYGEYKQYRIENEDICSIANTILKMSKKRSEVDAALLVGSLSELFTQDIEDLPEEYLNNKDNDLRNNPMVKDKVEPKSSLKKHIEKSEPKLEKKDDWASEKQVDLIKANIIASSLLTKAEKDKIQNYLDNGLTKVKASEIISWWLGNVGKGITGEREKRNTAKPDKDKPDGTLEKHFKKINEEKEEVGR
jgi:hypothetical protein